MIMKQVNEYDELNPAARDFSFRAVLNMKIRVPPSFVDPTPKDKTQFVVEFAQQLTFQVVCVCLSLSLSV
jgi:hypothetical protein